MTILERRFQAQLINDLRDAGVIVLKNDPNYLQGFPDLTLLYKNRWAVLETKRETDSDRQPNQPYYIEKLNQWSYASFVYPENKEQVWNELQNALRIGRAARLLGRQ